MLTRSEIEELHKRADAAYDAGDFELADQLYKEYHREIGAVVQREENAHEANQKEVGQGVHRQGEDAVHPDGKGD